MLTARASDSRARDKPTMHMPIPARRGCTQQEEIYDVQKTNTDGAVDPMLACDASATRVSKLRSVRW
ncbi:hypothetical protein EON66_02415 [archaeon]|nr:MAG: hypothetical protein EON66_02415 [archaeon]